MSLPSFNLAEIPKFIFLFLLITFIFVIQKVSVYTFIIFSEFFSSFIISNTDTTFIGKYDLSLLITLQNDPNQ